MFRFICPKCKKSSQYKQEEDFLVTKYLYVSCCYNYYLFDNNLKFLLLRVKFNCKNYDYIQVRFQNKEYIMELLFFDFISYTKELKTFDNISYIEAYIKINNYVENLIFE